MSLKWWEKTVEYKFVLLMAQSKDLFLAPLDGLQERAGDAVLTSGYTWVLIEFKKNANSITTEKDKFTNYEEARAALLSSDTHHLMIFGQASNEPIPQLELRSQTYFSGRSCEIANVLESGIEYDPFKEYIERYTKFKKSSETGSGGITMDDFALVAGVNTDNEIVQCLSLTKFQQQLELEFVQEHKLERRRGGFEL